MNILAIDPGPEQSAFIVYGDDGFGEFGKCSNGDLLCRIEAEAEGMAKAWGIDHIVIERIACMGMAVGDEVMETVYHSGKFAHAWEYYARDCYRIKRHEVKMHLCGNMRAKDANIRQALIDKLGKPGTKKNPGGTYGISGDVWSALAVAVTFMGTRPDLSP